MMQLPTTRSVLVCVSVVVECVCQHYGVMCCHKASQIASILKASDGSFKVLSTSRFKVLSTSQFKVLSTNSFKVLALTPLRCLALTLLRC